MNEYLKRLRAQYDAARTAAGELQQRAVSENRDLTADELTTANTAIAQCRELAPQIEALVEQETRNAAVGGVAASIDQAREQGGQLGQNGTSGGTGASTDGQQNRETTSAGEPSIREIARLLGGGWRVGPNELTRERFYAQDRDPGHYRSTMQGGTRSFFGDIWIGRQGDREAIERLEQHNRAVTTGGAGAGVVAPHWLIDEFQLLNRQSRALASRVRNIPLGGDPRPMTLPKQTAGTDANVAVQTAEGTNNAGWGTDAWTSNVDTVTPKPYSGFQDVSRQMLDMGTPATDQLIYGDLLSVFDAKIETLVCNTIVAAATNSGVTFASDATNFSAATGANAVDGAIDMTTYVFTNRFVAPDTLATTVSRFGKFRKLKDSTGRPLMPVERYSPMNAAGMADGATLTGEFEGLTAIPTTGLGLDAGYPQKFYAIVARDTILFEDPIMRFRFEEVVGPSDVRLGIWAYAAAVTRQGGLGTAYATVTAA